MAEVIRSKIVVIGLGAVGSAVLYRLAQRGMSVIGIDRYHPPHGFGSSHGASRITRLSVGEGEAYAPLVRRSHELWRELERQSGTELLLKTGGLLMAPRSGAARHHGKADFISRTAAVAQQFGIAHERLDDAAIHARFPQFRLTGSEIGYYEPDAGILFPERCIETQLRFAEMNGAATRYHETVSEIRQNGSEVTVVTNKGTIIAERAVVTAGPWVAGLLKGAFATLAKPYRQTLHWFRAEQPELYAPGRFPVFIWMHGETEEDYFYGFPALPDGLGVKIATEQYGLTADPETMVRGVDATETAALYQRHVAGRLIEMTPVASRAESCLYTVTPDAGFIVDAQPGHDRVLVISACSGHGFKHSAALGEAVAETLTEGGSRIDLSAFSLARYDAAAA